MRVGRLFGIEVDINASWLFIFALVAWSLASPVGPLQQLPLTPTGRAAVGIVAALLLFASVLAHEIAHSLVSRAFGIEVAKITLYLFGGVSQLKGAAQTPAAEALITFAGPLTSFIIAAIASPIGAYLGPHTATGAVAGYLGTANFVLGAFNLIPAVPLDGGRLLHALLWRITKDSSTATKTAVDFSRLIAGAIIAFGILSTIAFGSLGGLWLVLIGWFILQAGSAERAAVDIVDVFAGKKAVDLAAAMPEPIPADASVSSALDRLLKSGRNAAPVMLGERLLGIVTLSDFFRNGERSGDELPVTAIMTRVEDLKSAMPSADAMDIVRMMGDNGYRQIPLIDASGHLAGFVTREGVLARISAHRHTH